jgi:hypothetical protein
MMAALHLEEPTLKYGHRVLQAAVAGTFLLSAVGSAESGRVVSRSTAIVHSSADFSTDYRAARASFRTFDFDGFLLGDGTWQIVSRVPHGRLLCATYEVGARFGVGSPGCTDVKWLSDLSFVTQQRQCNQAVVVHSGGQTEPQLGTALPNISCVEHVVRCTGNCN